MIDVAFAVRARILAQTDVTDLVNQRVFTQTFPQNVTLPAVRVQAIDEDQPKHLRGPSNLRTSRVQVDSVGLTRASAAELDEAIYGNGYDSGLSNYSGSSGGLRIIFAMSEDRRELYDPEELRQFRIQRDYMVTWMDS